ncbi:MAG: EVE domain-containing protein [Infirmifilum sp.]
MATWVLSGTPENWEVAVKQGVWGVGEKARNLWGKVQPGDRVVFYATRTGVIGYGVVEEKFVDEKPLWPREKQEGRAIWPYRLRIRVEKLFPKPKPRPEGMLVAFAINKLSESQLDALTRD